MQVVLFLVTSPHFRSAAVTPTLIADLSQYLTASSGTSPAAASAASMAEFKEHMMHVVESICQVRGDACVLLSARLLQLQDLSLKGTLPARLCKSMCYMHASFPTVLAAS
jgi:hypothetical protein